MDAGGSALTRSLVIQGRVIGALLMREIITRYGRNNIGFLWLFLEPMMFTLGIMLLWNFTSSVHGSSMPVIPFAITGYSTVLLWRNGVGRCTSALEANRALLFHRNVRLVDVFWARLLLEVLAATTAVLLLLSIFLAMGSIPLPHDPLVMVGGWLLTAWFAMGLAFTVGALASRFPVVGRLWQTLTYLMFPLSGALFMLDWLPAPAREILFWVPMIHGTEMLRAGYFGDAVRTYYSVGYYMMVNLGLTLVGLFLVRDLARRVEGE